MGKPSYCTLVLIAVSCCIAVCSHAKAVQGTNKLDLANRISGSVGGKAAATQRFAAEARQKRAMGEYKELNNIIDELGENSLLAQMSNAGAGMESGATATGMGRTLAQQFNLGNMQPLVYYLLVQKLRQLKGDEEQEYRVRTPRLGRSIDFQQLLDVDNAVGEDDEAVGAGMAMPREFVSRMLKKSVPYKPRLGKRAQVCGSSGSGSGGGGGGGGGVSGGMARNAGD